LLKNKQDLLACEEAKWGLKSRAIWLEGDNNNIVFHNFVNYRKNLNSIWEIKDQNGQMISSFKEISKAGKGYFCILFKESKGFPISEILKDIDLFPRSFSEDMNESL
jgi:hypothetical protein